MSKKVRWAILGAGKIARSFVNDFAVVQNAEIVGVAASDIDRATAFAAEFSLPNTFTYDELYKSDLVDAVYVATTHNFHFEQCRQCILHKKNVLCEKPITLNDREFKQLMHLAKENNVFLMEAMWTWFLPPVLKAMQWVNEGRIGKLTVIEASFGVPMEKNLDGRLYNINLAGGALLDLGVYNIALATLFTGKMPDKMVVSGVLTQTGVDERVGILLEYGDVSASLYTSMINIMSNKAMLNGDKGYIELPEFYKCASANLYDSHHNLLESFTDIRTTKGYNFEIQHATDLILQGKLESDIASHAKSNMVQEIMTEVRRRLGVLYPGELV